MCGLLRDSSRSRQPPPGTVFDLSGPGFALFHSCPLAPYTYLGSRPPCWLTRFGLAPGKLGPTRFQRFQMACDGRCDVVDRRHAIHGLEHAFAGVIVDQRSRSRPIGRKASLEYFGIVVCADLFAPASHFSHAPLNALKENAFIHLQLHDRIEFKTPFSQQTIKRLRLRHGARKSVKHEAAPCIGLPDAVSDDRDNDVIGNELAAFHDALYTQPDGRTGRNRGTQHVARRKLDNPVFGYQALRLRALPRPRRAEQDQSHRVRPRNLDRLISPSYW